jgi:hypothetical protein
MEYLNRGLSNNDKESVLSVSSRDFNRLPDDYNLLLSIEQGIAFRRLTLERYSEISRIIYGGQAGGGKSFLICLWLDTMALKYEGTRYYLSRERLKDIKESVLLTFWDVIKLTGSVVKYNATSGIISYPNGSQIYLVEIFAYPSDPNFDSLGSREYTAGAIEEGITVTRRAADILLSRTRYKHDVYNLFPKQLITCNPGDGWIKDDIVVPSLEGTHTKPNEIFIRATLQSNPNKHFREQYEKTLDENLTEFDKARLLHGDWNAKPKSGAEYLKEYLPDLHYGYTMPYDKDLPLHISFDENVNPYITCLIFQVIEDKDGIRTVAQIDEICKPPPQNTRRHVCNDVIKRFGGQHRGGMFIYGDATSFKNETGKEYGENFFTEIMNYLRAFDPVLRVPTKNPPVMSKGGFLNLILRSEYKRIRFRIDARCKLSNSDYAYSLEDMDGGILKSTTKDPFTGITYQKQGHHVDSMSYFFTYYFSSEFDYYLGGDFNTEYDIGTDRTYKFRR